jgi:heterodisulfide reductase subunit B
MAAEYDHSIRAIASVLELELVEPDGWLCCGSSPAHRADPDLALRLPMQNLALIEQMELGEVTLPCAMCFNRFRAALHETGADPALKSEIETEVGYHFKDSVAVRSLLDVLVNRVGLDKIASQIKTPLAGLKVACYYGCLLTRPPKVTHAEQPEYPMMMDSLMSALGATAVDWGSKTACCGASLSITRTDIVLDLSARILADARAAGADAVVVACPLCHANLDGRQHQMPHPPAPSPEVKRRTSEEGEQPPPSPDDKRRTSEEREQPRPSPDGKRRTSEEGEQPHPSPDGKRRTLEEREQPHPSPDDSILSGAQRSRRGVVTRPWPPKGSGEGWAGGEAVPVFYFTQLMALSFGLGEKAAALSKNMVDTKPLLREKGILR